MEDSLTRYVEVLLGKIFSGELDFKEALAEARDHVPELYEGLAALLRTLEAVPTMPGDGIHESEQAPLGFDSQLDQMGIGPYRIIRVLGKGGMGVVYHGYRVFPFFRQAAVKLLDSEQLSPESRLRFRWECQALASLQHPNIARVYEAGECGEGIYYAMELLDGEPITAYCDRLRLTVEERVHLFGDVCEAVHHAHNRAIVHRDLKPDNILIIREDDKPIVKIIDFGIAVTLGGLYSVELANQVCLGTAGTPGYSAPEQWKRGTVVDIRQDIYALGAVLRETVLGFSPLEYAKLFHGKDVDFWDLNWELAEDGKFNRVACDRNMSLSELKQVYRSDLNQIIMRATASDPGDRYDSVAAIISDLKSFGEGRPLIWSNYSMVSRAVMFAKRRPRNIMLSLLFGFTVGAGLIAGLSYRHMAEEALRERAELQDKHQSAIAKLNFIRELLERLVHASMDDQTGDQKSFPNMLLTVADDLDSAPAGTAEPVADSRLLLGRAFFNLGRYGQASAQYYRAYIAYENLFGPLDQRTLDTMTYYANSLVILGSYPKAEAVFRDLLALQSQVEEAGLIHRPWIGLNYANLKIAMGENRAALKVVEQLLPLLPLEKEDHAHNLWAAKMIQAKAYVGLGELGIAKPLAEEAYRFHLKHYGDRHRGSMEASFLLARVHYETGADRKAETLLRSLLGLTQIQLGLHHPVTLEAGELLSLVLSRMGQKHEAMELMDESLKARLNEDTPLDLLSLKALTNLLALLIEHNQLERASQLEKKISQGYLLSGLDNHTDFLQTQQNFGELLRKLGNFDRANEILNQVYHKKVKHHGEYHRSTLITLCTIGQVLMDRGFFDRAYHTLTEVHIKAENHLTSPILKARFRIYLAESMIGMKRNLDQARNHLLEAGVVLAACPEDLVLVQSHLETIERICPSCS